MIYSFDNFHLDTSRTVLLEGEQTLPLTPRIFDTLLYLVEHHGRVVSKEELMKAVWPDAFVEENNLTQSISSLRRVLGERKGENRFIVTVAGRGYRFAAVVTKRAATDGTAPGKQLRIAVLPFKPLVEKHQDEALQLGMADALIIRLSSSREMTVRPLTSVRRFVRLDQDAQAAGRELGVESVVDGTIQRAEDRIRVSAQLISVNDGASLWAGTFDEKFTDVFSVQDAISERVGEALKLRLTREARHGLTKRYTENTAAYELYLQGRYHWSKLIPPEVRKAIEYFERAIAIDKNYALAYAGMAVAYISLPVSCDVPPQDAFPKAKAAALQALQIDDSLHEAYAYLAFVSFWFDWDWQAAETHVKRGLALNPDSAELHRAYGILLSQIGRLNEAIAEGVRARELDPLSLITRVNEALHFYFARDYETAQRKIDHTLELEPHFWVAQLSRARIYVQQGKLDEAILDLKKAKDLCIGSMQPLATLGYVFAVNGQRQKALAVLEEMQSVARQRYVPPYNFALLYHGLLDEEQVFVWLEDAYEARDVLLAAFINNEPAWDGLREDTRFRSLLQRMNLESTAA
jgi:serine/threonine-protein kinase